MTTKLDYINYKFLKAEESVKAAKILLENNLWGEALSRIYYAAFYGVSALLINLKLNPKTHGGAKSLFHKEFVMTGIIDKNFSELYDTLLAKRFEVDYEMFAIIDEEKVQLYLESVIKFIEKAKELTGYNKVD